MASLNENRERLREQSTGDLVARLSEQVSRLVREEIQLAKVELRDKGKRAGVGAGLFGGAGLLALYGLAGVLTALVLLLALVLPAWAAALIVGGALLVLAGILALVGRGQIRRATPPVPQEAMAGVKRDLQVVRERARR
ncbi:MAG TPA: phage holin family protein [Pseudonocardiaceae bacterium]